MTKVHLEARRFAADDYDIVLIGHAGHEEVVGTTGQAPERIHLVDNTDEAATVQVRDPERVAYLSQTTLSVDETVDDRQCAARAVPGAAGPAERRHLLRHAEPAVGSEIDRAAVRAGARGRLA